MWLQGLMGLALRDTCHGFLRFEFMVPELLCTFQFQRNWGTHWGSETFRLPVFLCVPYKSSNACRRNLAKQLVLDIDLVYLSSFQLSLFCSNWHCILLWYMYKKSDCLRSTCLGFSRAEIPPTRPDFVSTDHIKRPWSSKWTLALTHLCRIFLVCCWKDPLGFD